MGPKNSNCSVIGDIILLTLMFMGATTPEAYARHKATAKEMSPPKKLYWFIPDGMRADPDIFQLFDWARKGEFPNIKKLMEQGSYGYSISVFPTHTPVNFASLVTGVTPNVHGVADGSMHIEGRALNEFAVDGFSSLAKKVPPIWVTLEDNNKKVVLLSIPGSDPPELEQGVTVRARSHHRWKMDFYALNFQTKGDMIDRDSQSRSEWFFLFNSGLTHDVKLQPAAGWRKTPKSFSEPLETKLEGWGSTVWAYIFDSTNDKKVNYNKVAFSHNKEKFFSVLAEGQWSEWDAIKLKLRDQDVATDVKIKIIKLDINEDMNKAFFKVRFLYNNLNRLVAKPPEAADEIRKAVGPMVDFVDNFPAQLIYDEEDKTTFLEESDMSLEWHRKAAQFMIKHYNPDVFMQDINTPNQMLTSRWWMGYVDPVSARYKDVSEEERKILWQEVKDMYKKLDKIIGEYLANADKNTIIVLSSDHGAIPINKYVHVNNLLIKEGLLKATIDDKTGDPIIDWANSQVIFLRTSNIYINPDGLAGVWKRGSGLAYEALREKVKQLLINLTDNDGARPVEAVVAWEDAPKYFNLPIDRIGDLVLASKPGYGWNESIKTDMKVFSTPWVTGYKQAINPQNKGMWTPFIVMGPGVKKNFKIKDPINIIDQYPTLMELLGLPSPDFVEGRVLSEILDK